MQLRHFRIWIENERGLPAGTFDQATLADAILDRTVHNNAHRLQLKCDSLHKQKAPKIAAA